MRHKPVIPAGALVLGVALATLLGGCGAMPTGRTREAAEPSIDRNCELNLLKR